MAEQIFDIGPGTLVIFRFDTIAKTIAKVRILALTIHLLKSSLPVYLYNIIKIIDLYNDGQRENPLLTRL